MKVLIEQNIFPLAVHGFGRIPRARRTENKPQTYKVQCVNFVSTFDGHAKLIFTFICPFLLPTSAEKTQKNKTELAEIFCFIRFTLDV